MSAHDTETATEAGDETGASTAKQAVSAVKQRSRKDSLAMAAGGLLLARAVRSRTKTRTILQGLAGVALLGLGFRQRRARKREERIETGADARHDEYGEKDVSDDAHVERSHDLGAGRNADETESVYQSESEPNPRGMSDRSDIEEEGGEDIDFVEGSEPATHQEPHLDEEGAHDPRHHTDEEDEPTEVDLSEAAMADEASEAAGPSPEQSYPSMEGTDPEPDAEEAPPGTGEGAVAPAGTEESESGEKPDAESGERGAESGERDEESSPESEELEAGSGIEHEDVDGGSGIEHRDPEEEDEDTDTAESRFNTDDSSEEDVDEDSDETADADQS